MTDCVITRTPPTHDTDDDDCDCDDNGGGGGNVTAWRRREVEVSLSSSSSLAPWLDWGGTRGVLGLGSEMMDDAIVHVAGRMSYPMSSRAEGDGPGEKKYCVTCVVHRTNAHVMKH